MRVRTFHLQCLGFKRATSRKVQIKLLVRFSQIIFGITAARTCEKVIERVGYNLEHLVALQKGFPFAYTNIQHGLKWPFDGIEPLGLRLGLRFPSIMPIIIDLMREVLGNAFEGLLDGPGLDRSNSSFMRPRLLAVTGLLRGFLLGAADAPKALLHEILLASASPLFLLVVVLMAALRVAIKAI